MDELKEIIIELTNRCNLDCEFCFNRSSEKNDLPKELVFSIIDNAVSLGVEAVRLSGGEPLVYPEIFEVIDYAKSKGLYVIVNSNCTLISPDSASRAGKVDLLVLSMHEKSKFKILKEKIALLFGAESKIMLASIMTKENITTLEDYYVFYSNLCREHENLVEWFLLRPIPNKIQKRPIENDDVSVLYQKIKKLNKKFNLDVKIANAIPFCAISDNISEICKGGHFDSGYTRILIDCRGDYRSSYLSSHIIGNADSIGIRDAWNSEFLRKIRSFNAIPDRCRECEHMAVCRGGLVDGDGHDYLIKGD